MGRRTAELRVTGSLSNHNDEQDDADRAVWDWFAAEVRALAARPECAALGIEVDDHA